MRKYSCCFVVLRKKKVNKTGSGSGWVSASVWALRDCVRIKVGMGRQIFIKRGGGVSGAEPRLPLILRRLALSSPTPPHTALPPPPPSLSPFLPLPPLPSPPPPPALPRLCMTKFGLSVESGQHFHVCVHPSWERERARERGGSLPGKETARKKKKIKGFWVLEAECGFKRAETGCIPEYSGKRAAAAVAARAPRVRTHIHAQVGYARPQQTHTNTRTKTQQWKRELIRKISHRQTRTSKAFI